MTHSVKGDQIIACIHITIYSTTCTYVIFSFDPVTAMFYCQGQYFVSEVFVLVVCLFVFFHKAVKVK